jgi:hypothetical protein
MVFCKVQFSELSIALCKTRAPIILSNNVTKRWFLERVVGYVMVSIMLLKSVTALLNLVTGNVPLVSLGKELQTVK